VQSGLPSEIEINYFSLLESSERNRAIQIKTQASYFDSLKMFMSTGKNPDNTMSKIGT